MGIKVYGLCLSTSTAVVLAALHEKEVEYELVKVDLFAGANRKPEYLALQPFGQIPVLVDESFTVFESRAIARYIADKFEGQGAPLYGTTPVDHALVEQWLEVESQNFSPAAAAAMKELSGFDHPTDEKVLMGHFEKLSKVLDVYEARLSKSKYLAGEFFSLADLAHLPSLNHPVSFTKRGEITMEGRPHVKAWWADISSRPAWKKLSAVIEQDSVQFQPRMQGQGKQ
ncbi:unnamed protein product [Calypogeia fissa]